MHSDLHLHLARAARPELLHHRAPPDTSASARRASGAPVRLRAGSAQDSAVRRLTQLAEVPSLKGELLLAEVDGEPIAALALDDGRIATDPFSWTHEAVALLRLRASSAAT